MVLGWEVRQCVEILLYYMIYYIKALHLLVHRYQQIDYRETYRGSTRRINSFVHFSFFYISFHHLPLADRMLCKIDQHTDIFKKFCPNRGFFPRLFFIRSPHEKKLQIDPRYSTTILYIYTYKLLRKIGPGRPIERNTTLDTYNIYINILYIYIYTSSY